jgi:hypothetical protein
MCLVKEYLEVLARLRQYENPEKRLDEDNTSLDEVRLQMDGEDQFG